MCKLLEMLVLLPLKFHFVSMICLNLFPNFCKSIFLHFLNFQDDFSWVLPLVFLHLIMIIIRWSYSLFRWCWQLIIHSHVLFFCKFCLKSFFEIGDTILLVDFFAFQTFCELFDHLHMGKYNIMTCSSFLLIWYYRIF